MRHGRIGLVGWTAAVLLTIAAAAGAQQRPLLTEDPETIGDGRVLLEGGFEYRWEETYPASGLVGDLVRVPVLGVSIGLGERAELQIDGGYGRLTITERGEAPLSGFLTVAGDSTSSFEDLVVATKVRLVRETPSRPAFGVRFATRLPNASNQSGLGLDTTDFLVGVLIGKTVASIRVVGNVGLGILGDPTSATDQNDVLLYGLSFARALTDRAEVVGELNGHLDTREGDPPAGTENRGLLKVGARYGMGAGRVDASLLLGVASREPRFGFGVGYTYVFDAFRTP